MGGGRRRRFSHWFKRIKWTSLKRNYLRRDVRTRFRVHLDARNVLDSQVNLQNPYQIVYLMKQFSMEHTKTFLCFELGIRIT